MKQIPKKFLLLLLAAGLVLSLSACGKELEAENEALKQELSALMEENADLRQQLAELGQQAGLADFSAEYSLWDSRDGASVTITATPLVYAEGQSADLVVWLNGEEVEKMPFQWDGSVYTATVELPAADGYTFLCVLTTPDGTQNEIVLDSAEMDTLIYLESNLTAFLNLVVNDWIVENGQLILEAGYAQVQLPQLSGAAVTGASLALNLNGQEAQRQSLTLAPNGDEGSYEQLLMGTGFPMPEISEGDQLDLWLEVELSDSQRLSVTGGSWYYTGDELLLAVG